MTPKTISILVIRLMTLFLLFESLSSISYSIPNIVLWQREDVDISGAAWVLIVPLSYFIILLLLLKFAGPIAEKISEGMQSAEVRITWTKTELLAVFIAAICVFVVLSAIPSLVNDLYSILQFNERMSYLPEKERFNRNFLSMLGSIVQIVVGVYFYAKARYFAALWEKWQSSAA